MALTFNGKENCPDLLKALRAKDESAQSIQQHLELERKRRHDEKATALAERAALQERFQRAEAELESKLHALEADFETRLDEQLTKNSRLSEQVEAARLREAELLQRNSEVTADLKRLLSRADADAADLMAQQARVEAFSAELHEAQTSLTTSDEVRQGLLRELKESHNELDRIRGELKELHLVERSGREHSKAQHERLNAQCESLTRQANERAKEADVFQERSKRLEEQLKSQELEAERARREAEDRRKELDVQFTKSKDEVVALREELQGKCMLESKLKETIATLEAQVQDRKNEEARLRQEIFKLQTLADERDISVQSGKRREQHLAEQIAALEQRLTATLGESESRQTALMAAKSQIQMLEVDLSGARDSIAAGKAEVSRIRSAEEEAKQEVLRRSQQKTDEATAHAEEVAQLATRRAEEKVAQRDREVQELETKLKRYMDESIQSQEEATRLKNELGSSRAQQEGLQKALDETQKECRERLQALEESNAKIVELEAEVEDLQRKNMDVAEKAVLTSPQGSRRQSKAELVGPPESERIMAEMEVLSRSVASLQAAIRPGAVQEEEAESPTSQAEEDPDGHRSSGEGLTRHPPGTRWRLLQGAVGVLRERDTREKEAIVPEPVASEKRRRSSDATSSLESEASGFVTLPPAMSSKLNSRLPSKQTVPQEEPIATTGEEPSAASRPPRYLQVEEASLALLEHRMAACERRLLLAEIWRSWSAPAKVSALRARMELVLTDELRLASERRAREQVTADGDLDSELPHGGLVEGKVSMLKSLILEFRQRVAEALAEAPGASAAANGSTEAALHALVATLELGRGGFGRLLHASLFLYQKLRTLVPSELEVTMNDPLSRLVPVPFYVLPYKVRLALQRGSSGLARGEPEVCAPHGKRRGGKKAQLEDLQDRLPLCASDPTAVPGFLSQLLSVRATAGESAEPMTAAAAAQNLNGAGFRDGLDLLAADALTVYMSGWRLSVRGSLVSGATLEEPVQPPPRRPSSAPRASVASAASAVAAANRLAHASPARRELRLGSRPPR